MQMLLKRKENTWVLNLLNGTQMTKLFIVVMIVLYLDLKLPMESAFITTNVVASSTTKTGRHDIAEILLKVALSTKNQINHTF
jgi:hypothetical protein